MIKFLVYFYAGGNRFRYKALGRVFLMRIIAIDEIKTGMKLARAIYREEDGGILLRPNIELKENYIERIKELNYSHVYVLDPEDSGESVIYEQISEETRFRARGILKKTFKQMDTDEIINAGNMKSIINEIIDQVCSNIDVIYNFIDIRSRENYIYAHSVNVCIISMMIGMEMGLNRIQLSEMGIGAFLHDMGMVCNRSKSSKWQVVELDTDEDFKKHPRSGYELIKKKMELSFLSAHVVLQHHEREDGSGYPRGLAGKRIHRFAKIVAVADSFDTLAYQKHQKLVAPYRAISEIKACAGKKYDQHVVDSFVKIMAPYPVGCILSLSNGETVIVEYVSRYECRVKVIAGNETGKVYNLYQFPKISVEKVL